ncbi:hypothetical protein [Geomonas diazotrophica]|uniref:hypothetical protein n=1 Tax=Geomonas diazotrophica TaxID=2843197 RepID=UPI001EF0AC79|nr:hypothetical protein [Geomonas nitrogeniifigens]
MTTFQEVRQKDVAEKPKVMETQRRLLESRYDLRPRLSPDVRMSRGKPVAVGPTARLGEGTSWEKLAALPPAEIRSRNLFPYPPLPHPKQVNGGQVFPRGTAQRSAVTGTAAVPRCSRFAWTARFP